MTPETKKRLLLWLDDDISSAIEEDSPDLEQAFRDIKADIQKGEVSICPGAPLSDHDLIIEQLNLIMELTAQLDAAQNRVEELEQAHEVMDDFCKLSDLALRVDASNPTLPGAFTGTVSERLTRQFDYLSETQTNGSAWKSSESCSIP